MTVAAKQNPADCMDRESITLGPAAPTAAEETHCYDMIATRAYEIWQRHGTPHGTAFQDWLAAEAELRCHR